jgi:adenylate kinase
MIATEHIVALQEGERLNLVVLGPPGVGKGTQAERIASALGIPHISSGDLFRKIMATDSSLGRRLHGYVDRGEYVPDDLVEEVIHDRLTRPDATRGFILDGFPRTVDQAEVLDRWLAGADRELDLALDITAPAEVLTDRMILRGATEHRADDSPDVFATRLKRYVQRTQPVIGYYARQRKLVTVDGSGSIDEVGAEIDTTLQQARKLRRI